MLYSFCLSSLQHLKQHKNKIIDKKLIIKQKPQEKVVEVEDRLRTVEVN